MAMTCRRLVTKYDDKIPSENLSVSNSSQNLIKSNNLLSNYSTEMKVWRTLGWVDKGHSSKKSCHEMECCSPEQELVKYHRILDILKWIIKWNGNVNYTLIEWMNGKYFGKELYFFSDFLNFPAIKSSNCWFVHEPV